MKICICLGQELCAFASNVTVPAHFPPPRERSSARRQFDHPARTFYLPQIECFIGFDRLEPVAMGRHVEHPNAAGRSAYGIRSGQIFNRVQSYWLPM
jgi:hypothetical protein